jgi:dipeptidyl aminopeptidase/acylaminoacyl peptidase
MPTWSPAGDRIAYEHEGDLWTMAPDGSDKTPIAVGAGAPDWSPDGTRIAFARGASIYTIRPDGTGLKQVTTGSTQFPSYGHSLPDWSPDGSRIAYVGAFDSDGETCYELKSVRSDGTGTTTVRSGSFECDTGGNWYSGPSWSPDGQRIASIDLNGVFTVRSNGTDFQRVHTFFGYGTMSTDWQPVPVETASSFVRPKSAPQVRVALVPAYKPCSAPNREHGPPLAFGSCSPPQRESSLSVGVGDGNPALANSIGFMRLRATTADASVRVVLTNVMGASDLSEYTGELRGEVTVRRTDREPGSVSSTSIDMPLGFTVPCTSTPGSSADASSCATTTSVNALVPGGIEAAHRTIWDVGEARVYDGGPDGNAETETDNSLFMTQGVFVP